MAGLQKWKIRSTVDLMTQCSSTRGQMSASGPGLVGTPGRVLLIPFSHSGSHVLEARPSLRLQRNKNSSGPISEKHLSLNLIPFSSGVSNFRWQEVLFPSSLQELLSFRPCFSSAIAKLISGCTMWASKPKTVTEAEESH